MKTFRKILASPFKSISLIGLALFVSFGAISGLIKYGLDETTRRLERLTDDLKKVKEEHINGS